MMIFDFNKIYTAYSKICEKCVEDDFASIGGTSFICTEEDGRIIHGIAYKDNKIMLIDVRVNNIIFSLYGDNYDGQYMDPASYKCKTEITSPIKTTLLDYRISDVIDFSNLSRFEKYLLLI